MVVVTERAVVSMIKLDRPEHFSEATLKEEFEFFESLGAFDLETYKQAATARARLVGMIQDFRKRGAEVVVLVMPDNPRLRAREPAGQPGHLQDLLRQAFPDRPPPVLDFQAAVDASGFSFPPEQAGTSSL
jgi:hypothetical protein